jgi:hypothetical protein
MGPAVILVPLLALGLGAAATAAVKKKKTTTATSQPLPTSLTVPPVNAPADVAAMVTSAINSGNPETMRRVAVAIGGSYATEAQLLNQTADNLQPLLDQWGASTLAEAQKAEAQQAALAAAQQAAVAAASTGAPPVAQVAAAQGAAAQTVQAAAAQAAAEPPLVTAIQSPGVIPSKPTEPPLASPSAAAMQQAMAAPAQALQAAQAAGTAALAAGATPTQAILAAQNAATIAASPAVNAIVQSAAAATAAQPAITTSGVPVVPMPTAPMATPVTSTTPATNGGRALAADMAKALRTAKKGTTSEPRALVQAFQTQERLEQSDGSYGFETAMALADRYGIVPPKPFYWGKKGGPASLPAKQKQTYSAHLLVLASQDPQRADEWRAAAKV